MDAVASFLLCLLSYLSPRLMALGPRSRALMEERDLGSGGVLRIRWDGGR